MIPNCEIPQFPNSSFGWNKQPTNQRFSSFISVFPFLKSEARKKPPESPRGEFGGNCSFDFERKKKARNKQTLSRNSETFRTIQRSMQRKQPGCRVSTASKVLWKGSKKAAVAETCGILRFLMVFGSPSSPVAGTNWNFVPSSVSVVNLVL